MGLFIGPVKVCGGAGDGREEQHPPRVPERPLKMFEFEGLVGSSPRSGASPLEQRGDYLPQTCCWLAKHDEVCEEMEKRRVCNDLLNY